MENMTKQKAESVRKRLDLLIEKRNKLRTVKKSNSIAFLEGFGSVFDLYEDLPVFEYKKSINETFHNDAKKIANDFNKIFIK